MRRKRKAENDWRPSTLTELRARVDKREFFAYEQLWEEFQLILGTFKNCLPVKEILAQNAQVTLNLLQTLIVTC
jgi:hypothetical protein